MPVMGLETFSLTVLQAATETPLPYSDFISMAAFSAAIVALWRRLTKETDQARADKNEAIKALVASGEALTEVTKALHALSASVDDANNATKNGFAELKNINNEIVQTLRQNSA